MLEEPGLLGSRQLDGEREGAAVLGRGLPVGSERRRASGRRRSEAEHSVGLPRPLRVMGEPGRIEIGRG